ncbi:MAG: 4-hydroxy-3-methylbut-2-enyl diphosphate reductase [Pseudomonadota bacterium]
MKVLLANPRGFCAGVERAVETVERALRMFGAPVYVRHEIVHNQRVVQELRERGAVFVEDVEEIPRGAVTILSAHGVSRKVENDAKKCGLQLIDATCPLVTRVHVQGRRFAAKGYDVVLIGHRGHQEVEGTLGQIDGTVHVVATVREVENLVVADPSRVAYVLQTTLSVNDTREVIAALKARYPAIVGQDTRDICYATQNRQTAVLSMAEQIDVLVVVGAHNSSNSNRLREIGDAKGIPSYLVPAADDLQKGWFDNANTIGLTAGASAPEVVVEETIAQFRQWWSDLEVDSLSGPIEDVRFKLPAGIVVGSRTVNA